MYCYCGIAKELGKLPLKRMKKEANERRGCCKKRIGDREIIAKTGETDKFS